MAGNPRHFRVTTRKSVSILYSQAAVGRWLFDKNIDPLRLSDPAEQADLRVDLPSGQVAPALFLLECIRAYRNESVRQDWYNSYCPIRRYRSYRWRNVSKRFRHVRTTQEKRLHGSVLSDEGEPAVRTARRPKALPDLYDDLWRHNEKNWKRYRRDQWKPTKGQID